MLAGMAGQYMWGLKKLSEFELIEFVRPLWVSIIVFAAFWTSAQVQDFNFPAIAAAYQNGFFWKVVLEKEKPTVRS
jgi:hypothetical protein